MNVRAAAAQVIFKVVDKQLSLSTVLPEYQQKVASKDAALLQEIAYGVLRFLPRLEFISRQLIAKPLKGKQRVVHHLILVGLYQLTYMRVPAHAAVAETVNGIKTLKRPALKGIVNGVLRNFQRQQAELEAQALESETGRFSHPGWYIKQLKEQYPQHWQSILEANNQRPPMWLRVNQQQYDLKAYQDLLNQQGISSHTNEVLPQGLLLEKACDVNQLPEFAQGACSVQDGAAQLAAYLVEPQAGERILDCCAAPGGKTMHLLELQPQLKLVQALDIEAQRLERVEQNCQRLGLKAQIICGDASKPEQWWDGEQYDKILLDAPCSATGVIRRHPDIKWLRKAKDIEALSELQAKIIDAIWPLLKPGGTLVYATCSILKQENEQQIQAFLQRQSQAQHMQIEASQNAQAQSQLGWQLLPGEWQQDGFYYCKLRKTN